MILSLILAKRRIAKAVRPSTAAAWIPVLIDGVLLLTALFAAYPFIQSEIDARGYGIVVTIFTLFGLYFVPIQVVLITSSLWAAKSRGIDDGQD